MTDEPIQQRLSDAERDDAASMLREHFEAGRLDQAEFEERMSAALSARFPGNLTPLFSDLPDPHPDVAPEQPWAQPAWSAEPGGALVPRPDAPVPASGAQWLPMVSKLLWPVAIVMALVTGEWVLWIVLAIIGGIVLRQLQGPSRKPPPHLGR